MTSFKTFALAGIAAIALAATPASATELLYDFSSTSGTDDFSFTLDSNPTPSFFNGYSFSIDNVPITTNAGEETAILRFDSVDAGGVFYVSTAAYTYFLFGNPLVIQLYSGSEATPTMLIGEFAMIGQSFSGADLLGNFGGTLSVTSVNAAVPEPGTWAMMLMGFGAVGFSMRKARQAKAVLQAA